MYDLLPLFWPRSGAPVLRCTCTNVVKQRTLRNVKGVTILVVPRVLFHVVLHGTLQNVKGVGALVVIHVSRHVVLQGALRKVKGRGE